MDEQNRQFKGIWIPKEIWLSNDLSFQEKIILVEIDSYDNGVQGCFASNKHFVENFGITSTRTSQVIQSLKDKGYITIEYEKNGKEIIRRYLHICRPPYPDNGGMLKNDIPMLKNEIGVCQFDKGGYVKKLKDNNTYINNTNNNNNITTTTIYDFISENFGRTLNQIEFEVISQWEDTELTRYAIKQAVLNNVYNINYIDKILFRFKHDGIKTVAQAQESTNNYKKQKTTYKHFETQSERNKREIEELRKEIANDK